ncbi:MAG: bifunctional diaminohydroxyphosphoribosylaminopyrimidine deaminase/5-amino-6-(5-phosphoribosylamino)uracil reductase RibD [Candidatus Obscuribacterales bacterium]|nr:bifunctional diaminohydroxyphosphoribosylaminopyrimidine deaminase/5-amino-6-(5-phosphoribosylamino)uracil reductase RibD [Candidatus Obscuribacterales bacterium]
MSSQTEAEDSDLQIMRQAIALARQGEGRTAPNPAVGAIILDENNIVVGRGFHPRAGESHAEVFAFDEAGARARGGTLFVTLEPCCHHGRTPPCLDRVRASGVKRVVIGMLDPNPLVAGKSAEILRSDGIATTVGIAEQECRHLNRGFVKRMKSGLPWVALKLAVTLDGRIADRTGSSRWISGPEARLYVHELRNRFDCVLVGSGTALNDDPELTVRGIEGARNPVRAVFDPKLKVSSTARICRASVAGEATPATVIFCDQSKAFEHKDDFASHVQLIGLSDASAESKLTRAMRRLVDAGINSVLCEGGAKFAASMLEQQLVDEVHWIIATKFLVDGQALSALSGENLVPLPSAIELQNTEVSKLGDDVLIKGTVVY